MRAALLGLLAIAATAQDQTGRVQGVVLDAITHQPVRKATVDIELIGNAGGQTRVQDRQGAVMLSGTTQGAVTDTSGTFEFHGLPAGRYQIRVMHQSYLRLGFDGVRKNVEVSASEAAARVTVELVPGASVTGRVVDEDGDPLTGCFVQPRPAKNFNGGVPVTSVPLAGNDGSYRIVNIPAGKYILDAQCRTAVFQPRPLSDGPDPPPSAAYPVQYYAGASDPESAQIVELTPGAERSGIDFQMRPVPVTHIHGTLTAASADWHGRNDLVAQVLPLDPRTSMASISNGRVNPMNGSFEIQQVFPGPYRLIVFSRNALQRGVNRGESSDPVGATARVVAADKPIEISLPFHRGVDVSGTVEIEQSDHAANQITPEQIGIQLTPEFPFVPFPSPVQAGEDKSFTIKSVFPGEWRLRLTTPSWPGAATKSAFVKSAWLGTEDVTHGVLDLTSGSAPPLRILVSGNTATIRGTARDSQLVFAILVDARGPSPSGRTDSSGQFTITGLAPGKYRVVGVDNGAPVPDEGGQEVTLREGETAVIEVKPEPKP
jgi:protocatechuate 3,4-dioxygenase beta subunit